MSVVNLSSCNLYYEIIGQGMPLICIGGFTADHYVWDSIVPILSQYFQVVIFDNPGCGQSTIPNKAFLIQDFANIVIELCNSLRIEKAYFLGNSMGGAIVQQLAYAHSERVIKAIISNSFMNTKKLGFSLFAQTREAWFDSAIPQASVIHAMLAWAFSGNFLTNENINLLTELTLNQPCPQTKTGYQFQLQALLSFDSTSWIKEITVPCLFIASDEDTICFPSQIQSMAQQVKNSEYWVVQGSGHLPHIEYPQLFSDKVIEFLRKEIH